MTDVISLMLTLTFLFHPLAYYLKSSSFRDAFNFSPWYPLHTKPISPDGSENEILPQTAQTAYRGVCTSSDLCKRHSQNLIQISLPYMCTNS